MKFLFLVVFVVMSGCSDSASESEQIKGIESRKGKSEIVQKVEIFIQPFLGIRRSTVQTMVKKLKSVYSGEVQVNSTLELPANTLNKAKSRYRADSLIRYLTRLSSGNQLIIGVTNKDISTTKGVHADWGIMGLGFCPGKSCIVSTFRLKGNNRDEKLLKLALHELGHTQGLKHCPIKSCLMRDAAGKDHWNELTTFCKRCKGNLALAGWLLK
jgi:archaemetzincin